MKAITCRAVIVLLLACSSGSNLGCKPQVAGGEQGVGARFDANDPIKVIGAIANVMSGVANTAGQLQAANGAGNRAFRGNGLGLTTGDSTDASGGLDPFGPAAPAAPAGPGQDPQAPVGDPSASGSGLTGMGLIAQGSGGGSYPGSYCGPTSVRMVLAYYGIQADADEVALTNFGSGAMYTPGNGSSHEGMATALRHYGLQTNMSSDKSIAAVKAGVEAGHPVIVNLRGNYGPFYTNGHIVVVVGFTGDGDVIINDPAGGVQRTIPARTFMNCWRGLSIEAWK